MFRSPLSRWRVRSCGTIAAVAAAVGLGGCGSGAPAGRQRAQRELPGGCVHGDLPGLAAAGRAHPSGDRGPQRRHADDPQRRGHDHQLTCPTGHRGAGLQRDASSARAATRRAWRVARVRSGSSIGPPGPCRYSCRSGGPGGAVTAYANTWALGPLRPGATAKFDWGVTAVKAGQACGCLSGRRRPERQGQGRARRRGPAAGTFTVTITARPSRRSSTIRARSSRPSERGIRHSLDASQMLIPPSTA